MTASHEAPTHHQTREAQIRGGLTVLLLACSFGTVFLARNALGYLSPFLVEDLDL